MDFKQLEKLIIMIDNSKLAYFELENKDGYIKIDKSLSRNHILTQSKDSDTKHLIKNNRTNESIENKSEEMPQNNQKIDYNKTIGKDENFEFIKSPIVGTFYSKSSPDVEPFVSKGDVVHRGDIICIIEAMKLMNEITVEFDCEIIDIEVDDGSMVEYGKTLFKVKRI